MYFGIINDLLARKIYAHTGVDVNNYNLTLRASKIRKILLHSHGNSESEALRGQRAITKEDFLPVVALPQKTRRAIMVENLLTLLYTQPKTKVKR